MRRNFRIEKIRGQQSDALLVVTCVQHMSHGFERPGRGLARPHIVQHQKIRLEHRFQHAHFGGLPFGIVAILNFLQQFAVVVEKPGVPPQHNFLQRRDG